MDQRGRTAVAQRHASTSLLLGRSTTTPPIHKTPSQVALDVRINATSPTRAVTLSQHPRIIELLNLADFTNQVHSHVTLDRPLFTCTPAVVEFVGYASHQPSSLRLSFRNDDRVPRRIKVQQPDSQHFRIEGPFASHGGDLPDGRIAPGTEACYRVVLDPLEVAEYSAELVCSTEREKFIIPLVAKGHRAELSVPDSLDFGKVAVGSSAIRNLVVRNGGAVSGEVLLRVDPPFFLPGGVTRCVVQAGHTEAVAITFRAPEAVSGEAGGCPDAQDVTGSPDCNNNNNISSRGYDNEEQAGRSGAAAATTSHNGKMGNDASGTGHMSRRGGSAKLATISTAARPRQFLSSPSSSPNPRQPRSTGTAGTPSAHDVTAHLGRQRSQRAISLLHGSIRSMSTRGEEERLLAGPMQAQPAPPCAPMRSAGVRGMLQVTYADSGLVAHVDLRAIVSELNVTLSTADLELPRAFVTLSSGAPVTLTNGSNVAVEYAWCAHADDASEAAALAAVVSRRCAEFTQEAVSLAAGEGVSSGLPELTSWIAAALAEAKKGLPAALQQLLLVQGEAGEGGFGGGVDAPFSLEVPMPAGFGGDSEVLGMGVEEEQETAAKTGPRSPAHRHPPAGADPGASLADFSSSSADVGGGGSAPFLRSQLTTATAAAAAAAAGLGATRSELSAAAAARQSSLPRQLRTSLQALKRRVAADVLQLQRETPAPFASPQITITPSSGTLWPHSSAEFSVDFTPGCSGRVSCGAFLRVTGRGARMPLRIAAEGLGPSLSLSYDAVAVGEVTLSSLHRYDLTLTNVGGIRGEWVLAHKGSRAGFGASASREAGARPHVVFDPPRGSLSPGEKISLSAYLTATSLGEFVETFSLIVPGSGTVGSEAPTLKFVGCVTAPTFHCEAGALEFGAVAFGFPRSAPVTVFNTSDVACHYRLRVARQQGGGGAPDAASAGDFEACPASQIVEPGAALHATVGFNPTRVGEGAYDGYALEVCVVTERPPPSGGEEGDDEAGAACASSSTLLQAPGPATLTSLGAFPISAHSIVPAVSVLQPCLEFGDLFVHTTCSGYIMLVNPDPLPARVIIPPQSAYSKAAAEWRAFVPPELLHHQQQPIGGASDDSPSPSDVPLGGSQTLLLAPHSRLRVPIEVIAHRRGNFALPVAIHVCGSELMASGAVTLDSAAPQQTGGLLPAAQPQEGEMVVEVRGRGRGPTVSPTLPSLDFGALPCLRVAHRTLEYVNTGRIPAVVRLRMRRGADSRFTVGPLEGICIPPGASAEFALSALLDDTLRFADAVVAEVEGGDSDTAPRDVAVCAQGVGSTLVATWQYPASVVDPGSGAIGGDFGSGSAAGRQQVVTLSPLLTQLQSPSSPASTHDALESAQLSSSVAPPPAAGPDPAVLYGALDFGDVFTGVSATRSITLQNKGRRTVAVSWANRTLREAEEEARKAAHAAKRAGLASSAFTTSLLTNSSTLAGGVGAVGQQQQQASRQHGASHAVASSQQFLRSASGLQHASDAAAASASSYRLEPSTAVLVPGASFTFTVRCSGSSARAALELLEILSKPEGELAPSVAALVPAETLFCAPALQWGPLEGLRFHYSATTPMMGAGGAPPALAQQQQTLTLRNVSSLPLKFKLVVSPPFSLHPSSGPSGSGPCDLDDGAAEQTQGSLLASSCELVQQLVLALEPDEEAHLQVAFNAGYRGDRQAHEVSTPLLVEYLLGPGAAAAAVGLSAGHATESAVTHPHTHTNSYRPPPRSRHRRDAIPLCATILFPNVKLSLTQLDFGTILADTTAVRSFELSNPSASVPVDFFWSLEEEAQPRTDDAATATTSFSLDGRRERDGSTVEVGEGGRGPASRAASPTAAERATRDYPPRSPTGGGSVPGPWGDAATPAPCTPIHRVFDLLPISGQLQPGETRRVEAVYHSAHRESGSRRAVAVCQVADGPEYRVSLDGATGAAAFRVDTRALDFGSLHYTATGTLELLLLNTGAVEYRFEVDTSRVSMPGRITASPSSGRLGPGETRKVQVRMTPGVPLPFISEVLLLRIAHFEAVEVTCTATGTFGCVVLRGDGVIPITPPSSSEEGASTISPSVNDPATMTAADACNAPIESQVASIRDSFCAALSSQIAAAFDAAAQAGARRDSSSGGAPSALQPLPSIMDALGLSAHLPSMLASVTAMPVSAPSLPEVPVLLSAYALDFGTVVVGGPACRAIVHLINGADSETLVTLLDAPAAAHCAASGFSISHSGLRLGAGCAGAVELVFAADPRIYSRERGNLGQVEVSLRLAVKGGPAVCLVLKARTEVPMLLLSPATLDFGTVLVGRGITLAFQLHNTSSVPAAWRVCPPSGLPLKIADRPFFAVSPPCGELAPGERCVATASFIPDAARRYALEIPLRVSGSQEARVLALGGWGEEARFDVSVGATACALTSDGELPCEEEAGAPATGAAVGGGGERTTTRAHAKAEGHSGPGRSGGSGTTTSKLSSRLLLPLCEIGAVLPGDSPVLRQVTLRNCSSVALEVCCEELDPGFARLSQALLARTSAAVAGAGTGAGGSGSVGSPPLRIPASKPGAPLQLPRELLQLMSGTDDSRATSGRSSEGAVQTKEASQGEQEQATRTQPTALPQQAPRASGRAVTFAVVGAPGCGASSLAAELSRHYGEGQLLSLPSQGPCSTDAVIAAAPTTEEASDAAQLATPPIATAASVPVMTVDDAVWWARRGLGGDALASRVRALVTQDEYDDSPRVAAEVRRLREEVEASQLPAAPAPGTPGDQRPRTGARSGSLASGSSTPAAVPAASTGKAGAGRRAGTASSTSSASATAAAAAASAAAAAAAVTEPPAAVAPPLLPVGLVVDILRARLQTLEAAQAAIFDVSAASVFVPSCTSQLAAIRMALEMQEEDGSSAHPGVPALVTLVPKLGPDELFARRAMAIQAASDRAVLLTKELLASDAATAAAAVVASGGAGGQGTPGSTRPSTPLPAVARPGSSALGAAKATPPQKGSPSTPTRQPGAGGEDSPHIVAQAASGQARSCALMAAGEVAAGAKRRELSLCVRTLLRMRALIDREPKQQAPAPVPSAAAPAGTGLSTNTAIPSATVDEAPTPGAADDEDGLFSGDCDALRRAVEALVLSQHGAEASAPASACHLLAIHCVPVSAPTTPAEVVSELLPALPPVPQWATPFNMDMPLPPPEAFFVLGALAGSAAGEPPSPGSSTALVSQHVRLVNRRPLPPPLAAGDSLADSPVPPAAGALPVRDVRPKSGFPLTTGGGGMLQSAPLPRVPSAYPTVVAPVTGAAAAAAALVGRPPTGGSGRRGLPGISAGAAAASGGAPIKGVAAALSSEGVGSGSPVIGSPLSDKGGAAAAALVPTATAAAAFLSATAPTAPEVQECVYRGMTRWVLAPGESTSFLLAFASDSPLAVDGRLTFAAIGCAPRCSSVVLPLRGHCALQSLDVSPASVFNTVTTARTKGTTSGSQKLPKQPLRLSSGSRSSAAPGAVDEPAVPAPHWKPSVSSSQQQPAGSFEFGPRVCLSQEVITSALRLAQVSTATAPSTSDSSIGGATVDPQQQLLEVEKLRSLGHAHTLRFTNNGRFPATFDIRIGSETDACFPVEADGSTAPQALTTIGTLEAGAGTQTPKRASSVASASASAGDAVPAAGPSGVKPGKAAGGATAGGLLPPAVAPTIGVVIGAGAAKASASGTASPKPPSSSAATPSRSDGGGMSCFKVFPARVESLPPGASTEITLWALPSSSVYDTLKQLAAASQQQQQQPSTSLRPHPAVGFLLKNAVQVMLHQGCGGRNSSDAGLCVASYPVSVLTCAPALDICVLPSEQATPSSIAAPASAIPIVAPSEAIPSVPAVAALPGKAGAKPTAAAGGAKPSLPTPAQAAPAAAGAIVPSTSTGTTAAAAAAVVVFAPQLAGVRISRRLLLSNSSLRPLAWRARIAEATEAGMVGGAASAASASDINDRGAAAAQHAQLGGGPPRAGSADKGTTTLRRIPSGKAIAFGSAASPASARGASAASSRKSSLSTDQQRLLQVGEAGAGAPDGSGLIRVGPWGLSSSAGVLAAGGSGELLLSMCAPASSADSQFQGSVVVDCMDAEVLEAGFRGVWPASAPQEPSTAADGGATRPGSATPSAVEVAALPAMKARGNAGPSSSLPPVLAGSSSNIKRPTTPTSLQRLPSVPPPQDPSRCTANAAPLGIGTTRLCVRGETYCAAVDCLPPSEGTALTQEFGAPLATAVAAAVPSGKPAATAGASSKPHASTGAGKAVGASAATITGQAGPTLSTVQADGGGAPVPEAPFISASPDGSAATADFRALRVGDTGRISLPLNNRGSRPLRYSFSMCAQPSRGSTAAAAGAAMGTKMLHTARSRSTTRAGVGAPGEESATSTSPSPSATTTAAHATPAKRLEEGELVCSPTEGVLAPGASIALVLALQPRGSLLLPAVSANSAPMAHVIVVDDISGSEVARIPVRISARAVYSQLRLQCAPVPGAPVSARAAATSASTPSDTNLDFGPVRSGSEETRTLELHNDGEFPVIYALTEVGSHEDGAVLQCLRDSEGKCITTAAASAVQQQVAAPSSGTAPHGQAGEKTAKSKPPSAGSSKAAAAAAAALVAGAAPSSSAPADAATSTLHSSDGSFHTTSARGSLAPGSTTIVLMRFSPLGDAPRLAQFRVTFSGAAASDLQGRLVTLRGYAVDPRINTEDMGRVFEEHAVVRSIGDLGVRAAVEEAPLPGLSTGAADEGGLASWGASGSGSLSVAADRTGELAAGGVALRRPYYRTRAGYGAEENVFSFGSLCASAHPSGVVERVQITNESPVEVTVAIALVAQRLPGADPAAGAAAASSDTVASQSSAPAGKAKLEKSGGSKAVVASGAAPTTATVPGAGVPPGVGAFSTPTPELRLGPLQSKFVEVKFNPGAVGSYSATLVAEVLPLPPTQAQQHAPSPGSAPVGAQSAPRVVPRLEVALQGEATIPFVEVMQPRLESSGGPATAAPVRSLCFGALTMRSDAAVAGVGGDRDASNTRTRAQGIVISNTGVLPAIVSVTLPPSAMFSLPPDPASSIVQPETTLEGGWVVRRTLLPGTRTSIPVACEAPGARAGLHASPGDAVTTDAATGWPSVSCSATISVASNPHATETVRLTAVLLPLEEVGLEGLAQTQIGDSVIGTPPLPPSTGVLQIPDVDFTAVAAAAAAVPSDSFARQQRHDSPHESAATFRVVNRGSRPIRVEFPSKEQLAELLHPSPGLPADGAVSASSINAISAPSPSGVGGTAASPLSFFPLVAHIPAGAARVFAASFRPAIRPDGGAVQISPSIKIPLKFARVTYEATASAAATEARSAAAALAGSSSSAAEASGAVGAPPAGSTGKGNKAGAAAPGVAAAPGGKGVGKPASTGAGKPAAAVAAAAPQQQPGGVVSRDHGFLKGTQHPDAVTAEFGPEPWIEWADDCSPDASAPGHVGEPAYSVLLAKERDSSSAVSPLGTPQGVDAAPPSSKGAKAGGNKAGLPVKATPASAPTPEPSSVGAAASSLLAFRPAVGRQEEELAATELSFAVAAAADWPAYEVVGPGPVAESRALAFAPTMQLQSRGASFEVRNTAAIGLHYAWSVEGDAQAFSVSPGSGAIPAGAAASMRVIFSPTTASHRPEGRCTARAVMRVTPPLGASASGNPAVEPLVVALSGAAQQAACHLEVPASSAKVSSSGDVPVLEVRALGVGTKAARSVTIVNTSGSFLEYEWRREDDTGDKPRRPTDGGSASPAVPRPVTLKGIIEYGARVELPFAFTASALGAGTPVRYSFTLPSHGVSFPLLVVGTARDPRVSLDRAALVLPPMPLGGSVTETVVLVNEEEAPLPFTWTISNGAGANEVSLSSMTGTIPARGKVAVQVTVRPPAEGDFSATAQCHVPGQSRPIRFVVKGSAFQLHERLEMLLAAAAATTDSSAEVGPNGAAHGSELAAEGGTTTMMAGTPIPWAVGDLAVGQTSTRSVRIINTGAVEVPFSWVVCELPSVARRRATADATASLSATHRRLLDQKHGGGGGRGSSGLDDSSAAAAKCVTISPPSGAVPPGGSVVCELSFQPSRAVGVSLSPLPLSLQCRIAGAGRTYSVTLSGEVVAGAATEVPTTPPSPQPPEGTDAGGITAHANMPDRVKPAVHPVTRVRAQFGGPPASAALRWSPIAAGDPAAAKSAVVYSAVIEGDGGAFRLPSPIPSGALGGQTSASVLVVYEPISETHAQAAPGGGDAASAGPAASPSPHTAVVVVRGEVEEGGHSTLVAEHRFPLVGECVAPTPVGPLVVPRVLGGSGAGTTTLPIEVRNPYAVEKEFVIVVSPAAAFSCSPAGLVTIPAKSAITVAVGLAASGAAGDRAPDSGKLTASCKGGYEWVTYLSAQSANSGSESVSAVASASGAAAAAVAVGGKAKGAAPPGAAAAASPAPAAAEKKAPAAGMKK